MQTTLRRAVLTATLTLGLSACSGSDGGTAPHTSDLELSTDRGGRATSLAGGASNLLGSPGQRAGLRLDTEPVVAPRHGQLFLFADGTFSYTHDGSPGGTDSFSYRTVQIDDPGNSSVGEVTVTITDPDPAPFAPADDAFDQAIGNLPFVVGRPVGAELAVRIRGSVLANDGGASTVVTSADPTTASGAAVEMDDDGSFSVALLPGFSGIDSFAYTAEDGGRTGSARVSITVDTPIWFVGGDGAGAGNGHSANPFRSLTELDAAQQSGAGSPGPGETIYLLPGAHHGALTLLHGQTLHGAGVPFERGALRIDAAAPSTVYDRSGDCITCADDNTLVGIRIGDTGGTGLIATDVRGMVVRDVSIVGTGQALRLVRSAIDLELAEVQSLASAGRGLEVEDCSGRLVIRDTVTVNNSDAEGLALAGWPRGSDFQVQGDIEIVAPALDEAVVLERIDGSFSGGALRVSGRTTGAVRIDDCDGSVTLGDVDADNPNEVVGTPFSIQEGSGTIRIASLDARGVLDDDHVVTDPQDPAYDPRLVEENGVALAIHSFDGTFEISALGPQGDGGTVDTVAGQSAVSVLRGTPDISLAALTVAGSKRSGLLFDDNSGVVHLDRVTVLDFGRDGGAGVEFRGAGGHVAITMWECRLDEDTSDIRSPSADGISIDSEQGGERTYELMLGDPAEPLRSCVIEDCRVGVDAENSGGSGVCRVEAHDLVVRGIGSTGLHLRSGNHAAHSEVKIVRSEFASDDTQDQHRGIQIIAGQGDIRAWLRDNRIDDCYDGADFRTITGTLSARFENNSIRGFTRNGIGLRCRGDGLDAELLGNVVSEGTAGGNYACGIYVAWPGDARILLEANRVDGSYAGLVRGAPVFVDADSGPGTTDLTLLDNTLGAADGVPLIAARSDHADSILRLRSQDQNGGTLEVVHHSGTVGIERLSTLGADNSGMTLSVSGTAADVTALPGGTVRRPDVILP